MTLVEKEKRGHSYTSARHPSLSDEKKAKIKQFTKDYAHKLLKRLKEKGKLRRVDSKQSLSTPAPRSGGREDDESTRNGFSTPSMTPGMTPSRGSGSVVLETPGKNSVDAEDDVGLVDDIFGQDEPDDGDDYDQSSATGMTPSRTGTEHGKSNGHGHSPEATEPNGEGPNAHLPIFEGDSGMDVDHAPTGLAEQPNGIHPAEDGLPIGSGASKRTMGEIKVDSYVPGVAPAIPLADSQFRGD